MRWSSRVSCQADSSEDLVGREFSEPQSVPRSRAPLSGGHGSGDEDDVALMNGEVRRILGTPYRDMPSGPLGGE